MQQMNTLKPVVTLIWFPNSPFETCTGSEGLDEASGSELCLIKSYVALAGEDFILLETTLNRFIGIN